jgi:hypothetical protein
MAQDDVEDEAEAVDRRPHQSCGAAVEGDLGERRDPGARQRQRGRVAARPGAERRERDQSEELDAGHGRQRGPIERQVERRVHQGEHGTESEHEHLLARRCRAQDAPRATPDREHDCRGGQPEPRDAEGADVHEQQDGERRAEVVERRAQEHGREGGGGHDRRCRGAATDRDGLGEAVGHTIILGGKMGVLKT